MAYFTGVGFLDENGVYYGIKQVDNKPRVSAMPYTYDIAEGNIVDHTSHRSVGFNPDVDATLEDVCGQGDIINRPLVTTAMQIDGAHADDTGVVIYTSTTTGGSTTTLEDNAQNFTAGNIVVVGDLILLDDDIEFGIVSNVAVTILTVMPAFSGGATVGVGDNYRVIDKSAGGLGAQVLHVGGLDAAYAEQAEYVVTNGVGLRNLVNSYLRINDLHTLFTGGNETGTGTILLEDQATGLVTYAEIDALANRALQALFTVPAGMTMYLTDWMAGSSGKNPANVLLRGTVDDESRDWVPDMFLVQDIIQLENSTQVISYPLPLVFKERADVKVSATGTSSAVGSSFGFWLE